MIPASPSGTEPCGRLRVLEAKAQVKYTPLSIYRLAELSIKAGLPDGIFNYLLGEGQITGKRLVTHPDVKKIAFTGSSATGAKIMSDSTMHGVKPVHLELGGKTPQLVLSDCDDIDNAVEKISLGIFVNSGQVCTSGTRLIVHEKILNEVLDGYNGTIMAYG